MKSTLRLVISAAAPALLVGLLLGVAIGRSRDPFGIVPPPSSEGSATEVPEVPSAAPIAVKDLMALIEKGLPLTIVDVREPDEYTAVHIPNSTSIPLGAIWQRQDQIPHDHPVVVYCSSELRGEIAARELEKLGFTNVRYLDGGLSAWENAGLAVIR